MLFIPSKKDKNPSNPTRIYLYKVSYGNTRTSCETYLGVSDNDNITTTVALF